MPPNRLALFIRAPMPKIASGNFWLGGCASASRGYRRVVPSPDPIEIVELEVIQDLVEQGVLVIACGGGGIPVIWKDGKLQGVEAVIDQRSRFGAAGWEARC